jgi:chaperonin GroES
MPSFTPKNGRLLVKPDAKETKTASGIYLVEGGVDKPTTGTIIKGNEEYKAGDRVLFNKFTFDEFELEGETYYTVDHKFILGIF